MTRALVYVVFDDGSSSDTSAVRAFAAQRLGSRRASFDIVAVDRIPETDDGRPDFDALPVAREVRRQFRAAVSELEQSVVAVFEEVLAVSRVGLDDDFFELGGNSLIASQLVARLRESVSPAFKIHWLFDGATPAGLIATAAEIASAAAPRAGELGTGVLLPIRPHASGEAIFCVHPMLGFAWPYAGLVPYVDPDLAIFGLQTPAIEDDHAPTTIAGLARRYVDEILAVRSEGPYHLLGWSLGGVIAHEIATRLVQLGHVVNTLTVLDSVLDIDEGEFFDEIHGLLVGSGAIDPHSDTAPSRLTTEQADRVLAALGGQDSGLDTAAVQRIYAHAVATPSMTNGHDPQFFDGVVRYFRAGRTHPDTAGSTDGWIPYAREVLDVPLDCVHGDMMAPAALSQVGATVEEDMSRNRESG